MKYFYTSFLIFLLFSSLVVHGQSNIKQTDVIAAHVLNQPNTKLAKSDLQSLEITDSHTDKKEVTFVYLRQSYLNKPVFNGLGTIAMKNGLVVHDATTFVDNLVKRTAVTTFGLTYESVLNTLLQTVGVDGYDPTLNVFKTVNNRVELTNSSLSNHNLTFEQGFYAKDGKVMPVWKIWFYALDYKNMFEAYLDANTGNIINMADLVINCNFTNHDKCADNQVVVKYPIPKVSASQQTQAVNSYNVFAWPTESPNHANRQVVTNPADKVASPFGWHDVNGDANPDFTYTRGNNVWARDDKDANNTGGISPDGGSDLIFDASFNKSVSADLQLPAATINLFYWNNLMHDVWYHYGFDEVSGNFQSNNLGKGGIGNDYVIADAQDGSGTNNANFGPMPDGNISRMQMFLWSAGQSGEVFTVDAPGDIAGPYGVTQAGFGNKPLTKTKVKGKLVLVSDGSANPSLGCAALTNASAISGNIAVVDRGTCNFDDKVLNAQNAGAIAVVVVNNVGGNNIVMGGDASNINIPSVMISLANGNLIKNRMKSIQVDVTMYDSSIGGTFFYDSDFDNGIIAHEYTHGISSRLTGGASTVSCLTNTEQMGEGWSDFLSLVMTHAQGQKGPDKRGIGTYVRNEPIDGGGIRPYPYSTNFSVNPVTYDYIKLNEFTVPHGVGSVWCSMLWDLYWAFIDAYGYDPNIYTGTGGNNMVMHLVMDGLKLQPCGPGFVNGRDAIIKADELLNGGKNKLLIWTVFAKRGLGYSASQGLASSKTDGVQAFDIPSSFGGYVIEKNGPEKVNAGDTILYTIKVKNVGDNALKLVTITDSLSINGKFLKSDGRCNIAFNNNDFTLKVNDLPSKDSVLCGYFVLVDSTAGGKEISAEDFELNEGVWKNETITGTGGWARSMAKSNTGAYSFFVNNPASASDRTLNASFDLTETAKPYLMFSHYYNTETNWDGAVVEIEVKGVWKDLGKEMILNGYNNFIENNPASKISGQPAFTGNSNTFIRTIVDLTTYAGNVVNLRFRFVSDGLQGGEGWYIDDVDLWNNFGSITNKLIVSGDGLKPQLAVVNTNILNNNIKDTVVVIVVDVNEKLIVFPNPAGNSTNVKFESRIDRSIDLELFDITGKQLWEGSVQAKNTVTIPLEAFLDGMYVVRITDGETVKNVKLIKRSR